MSASGRPIYLSPPLTIAPLTTFTELGLMWWAYFAIIALILHLNTCPLLEPICNSFDVRGVVKRQGAELVAGPTALIKHDSVIPIPGESPDQYGHLLAAPSAVGAAAVVAFELAHHVRRVFAVGSAAFFAEPRFGDIARDGFRDIMMK